MKKLFFNVFLTLAILINSSKITVSQNFSIAGVVKDIETNEILAGANVWLDNTFIGVSSNTHGKFKISELKAGAYALKANFLGYEEFYQEINLNDNINLVIDLKKKVITTEEVVIISTKANTKTPVTFQNIDKKQIEKNNLGQDLPYILNLTPSIVTTSDAGAGIGYTGLRIRGTDISRINVTINGVPLNDPESHGVFWVNLPDLASSIENIQIQRGVGTSSNGTSAFGASINIQTDNISTKPFAEISSSVGSFNTFSNTTKFGTGLVGKWAFEGRLSMIKSDGYIDRAFSDLKSFYLSGAYFGKKTIVKFLTMGGQEKTYQAWMGVPKDSLETNRTFNPYTYENETDNYQQDHYSVNVLHQFNDNLFFNSTFFLINGAGYYEQYKDKRAYLAYGLNDFIIGQDTIIKTDLIQQKHLDNYFLGTNISLNYNKNNIEITSGISANSYKNDHFGNVIWMQYAHDSKKDYQWYFNKGVKNDISGFLKVFYSPYEKVNFYGDILVRNINLSIDGIHDNLKDITQKHSYTFFNPKSGVYYSISDHKSLYFSVAVANREPSRNSFRDAYDGVVPRHERLVDYEAGYTQSFKKAMYNIVLYYMDYKDQLVMTGEINNVGDPVMTNVPQSYRAGIEIIAGLKIVNKINLNANVSLSQNKINNFAEYVDNWDTWGQEEKVLGTTDISFSPNVVAGADLSYDMFKKFNISLLSKYVGEQYIDNTSSKNRMLDDYFVSDLLLSYNIKSSLFKDIALKFKINNIFNKEYESNAWVYRYLYGGSEYAIDGYFPQAGVNYMLGLTIKF